mmetsp:Transcript_5657/g.11663  ORF Transcript_5657/g.11663 Transcript_5657/m.11663 type:complete len:81 (-) Transcript_5657:129-371(-)
MVVVIQSLLLVLVVLQEWQHGDAAPSDSGSGGSGNKNEEERELLGPRTKRHTSFGEVSCKQKRKGERARSPANELGLYPF